MRQDEGGIIKKTPEQGRFATQENICAVSCGHEQKVGPLGKPVGVVDREEQHQKKKRGGWRNGRGEDGDKPSC